MAIDDDDFSGDDWDDTDYSQHIGSILDALGNLCGLLVTRPDLTEEGMAELEEIVKEAQAEDKIWNYMDTPYDTILDLIAIRREDNKVDCGLYDIMIKSDFNREAVSGYAERSILCGQRGWKVKRWLLSIKISDIRKLL